MEQLPPSIVFRVQGDRDPLVSSMLTYWVSPADKRKVCEYCSRLPVLIAPKSCTFMATDGFPSAAVNVNPTAHGYEQSADTPVWMTMATLGSLWNVT
jgi:hypothetical protein